MSKQAFHIYNFSFFILLLGFNSLALFGAGMSEGGIGAETWFAIGLSFVIWAIFYYVQFVRVLIRDGECPGF